VKTSKDEKKKVVSPIRRSIAGEGILDSLPPADKVEKKVGLETKRVSI